MIPTDEVRARLAEYGDGSKILIRYQHVRDPDTIRTLRGTLFKSRDSWVLKVSSTQRHRIPSEVATMLQLTLLEQPSRQPSAMRDEDAAEVPPLGEFAEPSLSQSRPVQPTAEPSTQSLLDMMKRQQDAHDRQNERLSTMLNQLIENRASTPAPREPERSSRTEPGSDVATLLRMSDALRGNENPLWRLAPGLTLPRFIPDRFMIVSVPHLLFKEDPSTGEMVRVPKGTAHAMYKALLPNCKLQFPNQVTVKGPKRFDKKEEHSAHISAFQVAGIRAQIERAERMFADLLGRLDVADSLPTTKSDWLIFIDAGASLLDLYSSLANGFLHGGAKVAQAYSVSIMTNGKYDPAKLWQPESDSFRE